MDEVWVLREMAAWCEEGAVNGSEATKPMWKKKMQMYLEEARAKEAEISATRAVEEEGEL